MLQSGEKVSSMTALGGLFAFMFMRHTEFSKLTQSKHLLPHFTVSWMFSFQDFYLRKDPFFCFPKARLYGANILPSNPHLQAKESCLGRSPQIAHTYLYVEILNLHPPKIKARQMMKSIPIQTATSLAVSMFLLHFVSAMKAA